MAYVPNASDVTQPTADKEVLSAAEEFRTLKSKVALALLFPNLSEVEALAPIASRANKIQAYGPGGQLSYIDLPSFVISGVTAPVLSSIASLRLVDKTTTARVFVIGYYAQGDGGGGLYWYDSTDVVSADNGGTLIVGADGGRWKLIYEDSVSVDQFGAVGNGATNDQATIQAALNSGVKIVRGQRNKNYKLTTGISIPAGVKFVGDGKANSRLTCGANITPVSMVNINDAAFEGFLIVAHATQTAPLILLDAFAATMARCRIRDVQGSGSSTDFPFISVVVRTGAFGSWAHDISDISVSGCGTIFKAESQFAGSWINSIAVRHVYANDFIRGMHLIATLGDGCADCTFFDWAAQTSASTQFGALIADVAVQGSSRKNSFTDVRFYDLPGASTGWYIGANVLDTTIQGLAVDDLTFDRIRDTGINTRVNGKTVPEYLVQKGRAVRVLSNTGFTQSVSGTATTQQLPPYAQLRTGATAGSVARLFTTDQICGLAQNQLFNVDFGRVFRIKFILTRIGAGASAIGRFQFKTVQTDGALAAKGLGLQLTNYTLFGESYGSADATVNLGVTMNDAEAYQIEIVNYPGLRVEWWVNGVLKGIQTTLANIPSTVVACYLHASLNNVAANDTQMLWSEVNISAA